MKGFIDDVNQKSGDYGSLPFWSWNDRLNEDELRRQMRVMKDIGMNGFFMHARGGLETEYLSDEWYSCINACIDEAKKLGMEAWSYDENGWPSGFAGGKCLENPANFATFLRMEEAEAYPEITPVNPPERNVLAVYVKNGDSVKLINSAEEAEGAEKILVVYQNYDSSYVDTMDARITKEFISYTHEDYKKRNGDDFGKAMPGFFTDEPQYFRYATVWSNLLPEEFKKAYGYDVKSLLPALFIDFPGADEFRYDYWALCHKLFINNFIKVIYDWCEENGCRITGHAVEESALFTQMWCCGGIMPFYEYEHIPGIDYLGRNIGNDVAGKQVGSVAAQLGKKKVMSEMFGCCGWDVTPTELKKIAELQYSSGVNIMCQHLYSYSIRGQRKRDYPAHYSEHLPWQSVMGDFDRYFNRLGYVLSMGKERVNTLIIHPIHSCYLTYKREIDYPSVKEIEDGFNCITACFSDNQIPYHYGDECLMAKYASVEGKKLKVGICEYDYVVLPKIFTLDASTVALLKEFSANGGKVLLFDGAPDRIDGKKADLSWLKSTVSFEDILNDTNAIVRNADNVCPDVKLMTRDTDYGRIFYLVNVSDADYMDVKVTFKGVKGIKEIMLEELDWNKEPVKSVAVCSDGADSVIKTTFESGKSRVFVATGEDNLSGCCGCCCNDETSDKSIVLGNEYKLSKKPENALTLDYAEPSYDGVNFEEPQPIIGIFDKLLRNKYKGDLYLRYSFNVKELPGSLSMAMEPMRYKSIAVNGQPVEITDKWWLDRSFKTADILSYAKVGKNDITVSFDYYQRDYVYYVLYGGVSESLRNCLAFDTEVESMYLFGDFAVETENEKFEASERRSFCYTGEFNIVPSKDTVNAENVIKDGFPFFAGALELEQKFNYNGEGTELYVGGRYSYADVYVNGEFVNRLLFTTHCDISKFVKKGENTLKLIICNANRNLLGPHHFADPEPYASGPWNYSLESTWHDGKSEFFAERYSLIRFGIEVTIK